jgi:nitroreductase
MTYATFVELVQERRSVRKFKPDPLPEGAVEKILEAGRWAMSGANAQPWEYIVVTDPAVKKELFRVYMDEVDSDFIFWMEQMRVDEFRHPAFHLTGTPEEQIREIKTRPGWAEAPALIVIVGDGRRQWATVLGGQTFGRHAMGYIAHRGRVQTGPEYSGRDDRTQHHPRGLSGRPTQKRRAASAGRSDSP